MATAEGRLQVLLAEDGDILHFDERGARIADKAPAGRVLIDVTRTGEVGDEVLRDRRHLAGDGVVVAVIAINRQTGALVSAPEIVARGFVFAAGEAESLFNDAAGVIAECIATSSVEERTDQGLMTEKLRMELRRFLQEAFGAPAAGAAGSDGDLARLASDHRACSPR
jgi:ribonuclease J